MEKVIFSGMQPSGSLHLGNYIGAVSQIIKLQEEESGRMFFSIADLHAITVWQEPKTLKENIIKLAATLMACGLDADKIILFLQSDIAQHSELAWILNCTARMGWLQRMTQYKDKAGKNKENSSVGLFVYPNLQAADILLYNANLVPVGEDQKQHIELARDIAIKFNNDFNTDFFTVPEPKIISASRIMSLKDATKKMSKSDPSEYGKIMILDSDEDIVKKIMKAKTDSGVMPESLANAKERPEILNLLTIYSAIKDIKIEEAIAKYSLKVFREFKEDLADILVKKINPIREKYENLIANKSNIIEKLDRNATIARPIAEKNIKIIKDIVGINIR